MERKIDQQRPQVGVGVVVFNNGKVLLGKRKGTHGAGKWAFPGGHLEFGESVEECARRELAEETGLNILSIEMGTWVNNLVEDNKHYVTLFTFVDKFDCDLQLLEPDKCEGWEWFDWNTLPSPLFTPVRSFIEKTGIKTLTSLSEKTKN